MQRNVTARSLENDREKRRARIGATFCRRDSDDVDGVYGGTRTGLEQIGTNARRAASRRRASAVVKRSHALCRRLETGDVRRLIFQ